MNDSISPANQTTNHATKSGWKINYPWLRLWCDMPNDPKWRTIARASSRPITEVLSVYLHILVDAANAEERGTTQYNETTEDVATALDMTETDVRLILDAMQNRVLEGGRVLGWEKRQPKREDDSAERTRAWREGKKGEPERGVTHGDAKKRTVTLENKRGENKRGDIKTPVQTEFEQFWTFYPRRQGKKKAQEAFEKAIKKTHVEVILEGAKAYYADPNRDPAFTALPATWLTGERWTDEPMAFHPVATVAKSVITSPTPTPPKITEQERAKTGVPMPKGLREVAGL